MQNRYTREISSVLSEFIQTEEENKIFATAYEICEFKKGSFVLQKDDPWYTFGILIKGSIYSYFYNDDGDKKISGFYCYPHSCYIVDYENFVNETKVSQYYECFEDSVVLLFNGIKFYELYDRIPGIHKKRLQLAEERYFSSLNIIKLLQATNANEKVQELYNQSPELFKIFPYTYLASYLGMHRNTYRKAISNLQL
jgi:signal-transduction protein with cAMP-binding, CBS, and nucleotidyltransferase domain